ncbi:hypothetical protein [Streptomyces sp. NPDC059862]|uniref:hypothetical protein n=1 Tax=unclassified Streptomyces TaxID=2593676 RepID=UPI0036331FF2
MSPCTWDDYGTYWDVEQVSPGYFLFRSYSGKVLTRWDSGNVSLAWPSDVDDDRKYKWKAIL